MEAPRTPKLIRAERAVDAAAARLAGINIWTPRSKRSVPPPNALHLRVPLALRERAEQYALAERRSVSDVVNIALENFFKQSRPA